MASDKNDQIDLTGAATGNDAHNTAGSNMRNTSTTDEGGRVGERATAGDTAPHRGNDSEVMPTPPIPSSAPLDPEKLHVLLTYSTFLALTRHTSRPVVDLNMEEQVRQLDAFLAGDVTEDGVATHWSTDSRSSERLQQYKDLCNQLVPNLTAAIKKQSQINLNAEPKNRAIGDKNPEHQSLCKLFLAPNLVTMYGEWVEKSRRKGINPDFDPWTNAVTYGKLIQLFQSVYELQCNFIDWQHTPPKPVFNQTPHMGAEEFMRVMGNRDQIRVQHSVVTRLGRVFSQLDVIPETAVKYTRSQLAKMWRDKTRPKFIIPDPVTVTIPPRRRDMHWVNDDGVGKIWTRGESSWSPNFKFMVFDKATNAYVYDHLVDLDLLDKMELNDEAWVLKYRKKISQWRNRATGEATKVRDHWANEERAVVYKFANTWVKKNGIDKFVPRLWEGKKSALQAALVNKTGHTRSKESVCAWARKQMTAKPNEPLGILYAKGQKMATRIDSGEDVPDDERYPEDAIDVADFLAKANPRKFSKNSRYSSKRKRSSDDESDNGDIMNDPRNFKIDGDSDDNANLAIEAGDSDSDDEESPPPSPSKSKKRPKLTAKGKKQLGRAIDEQDAHFAKPKPLTKAEMDAYVAKHDAEAAAFEADMVGDGDDDEIDMDSELGNAVIEELVEEDED